MIKNITCIRMLETDVLQHGVTEEPGIFIENDQLPCPELLKENPNVPIISREDVP